MNTVRIANGQAFWGDSPAAPVAQVRGGDIDYLTLDYLAEITMSVLRKQYERDPDAGYARDFVDLMSEIMQECIERDIKVVANAGGVNPQGCAQALLDVAASKGISGLREFMHTHVSRVCTTVEGQALADNSDVLMSKTAPANLAAARRRYEDVLASILRSGIASGDFRDVPVRPVVKFIFAGLNSVRQWYQPSGEFPLERVVDDVMGILLTGVLAAGRSSSIESTDLFDRTRTEK
ncbi:MAG: acyclic terpene utilization AtuA family protein [Dietzia sp.]|nr:acyclic terpene utilization AtuA family protein [Dietzia sp.]